MRRDHRLSRRLFLSELGKGTVAVAVLGTTVAACSSDDGTDGPTEGTAAGGRSDEGTTTTAASATETSAAESGSEAEGAADSALQWERVNFGFVSAYVLARGNEVAIVDTGTAGNSGEIEQALQALSFGWADVDHVIVTHAHPDHIGGLDAVLMAAPDAIGYAGAGDIDNISSPRDLVSVTGGEEVFGLEILATPGHTPGHISPYDPATGLLVAGDAMVTEDGRLAGPAEQFSSDIDLARESVKALVDTTVDTILVGHGDPIVGDGSMQLSDLAAEL